MPLEKILLCDESPADLAYVAQVLGGADCLLLTAYTGEEAIRIAKAEQPDIIFMESAMPGLDGYASYRSLGEDLATRHIPIIFINSKQQKAARIYQESLSASQRLRLLEWPQYEPAQQLFQDAFFAPSGLAALAEQANSPVLVLAALEAVYYYFSNQYGRLSDLHLTAPSELWMLAQTASIALLQEPKKIHPTVLPTLLSGIPCDLQPLLAACKDPQLGSRLVNEAFDGAVSLPSPFSPNRAYCQESYEVAPDLNCLRFTDGKQVFFLVQLLSTADALYFPVDNVFLVLAHINESHVKRLQEKLMKDFAKNVAYATSSNTFAGVIASHSRPSHFYYDVWPALFELAKEAPVLENLPTIIMRKDHDFNDPSLLFSYDKYQVLDSAEIGQIACGENKWFTHIGRHQHLSSRFAYELADHYLLDTVLQAPDDKALAKTARLTGCYPIVWLGVEGQKRCWLEQVEGYAYILNQLSLTYPNLGVIFDGWTMPFTPSEASLSEAEKDHQVVQNILKQLTFEPRYVSVVGETSNTKLVVGHKADFFISNFATGSLHISRLLAKPGFGHLSRTFSEVALRYAMHIHPNPHVYLLPQGYISDLADHADIRHDYLSYSIDKKSFYQFIAERLPTLLATGQQPAIRYFIEPSYSVTYDLRLHVKMATQGNVFPVGAGEDKVLELRQYPVDYLQRQLIYGTFPFGSAEKAGLPGDYLIWLRAPLPRVCYHARELTLMAAHQGQTLTISDVFKVGHKVLDNYFTRMLSGGFAVAFGQCTEELLAIAIGNLQNHFIYIGINEKPTESYDLLCQVMDWDRTLFATLTPIRYELNSSDFSDEELHLAKTMNSFDLRLYEAALEWFNNKLGH
ncbi:response regulator [Methylovulum psychrotolerans]|uniref:Response regulatory domain-containing protein n=1 Tax=Methylovulum psychrotolerans TaxID=1704499 RepID=A0A1Z4BU55_9GAMM|nr:response regulator [Methylovulum psychrotolerans]ASF44844.1 hypothetical protein CEK71_01500 [Methylovulum psychrotolerans]